MMRLTLVPPEGWTAEQDWDGARRSLGIHFGDGVQTWGLAVELHPELDPSNPQVVSTLTTMVNSKMDDVAHPDHPKESDPEEQIVAWFDAQSKRMERVRALGGLPGRQGER